MLEVHLQLEEVQKPTSDQMEEGPKLLGAGVLHNRMNSPHLELQKLEEEVHMMIAVVAHQIQLEAFHKMTMEVH